LCSVVLKEHPRTAFASADALLGCVRKV